MILSWCAPNHVDKCRKQSERKAVHRRTCSDKRETKSKTMCVCVCVCVCVIGREQPREREKESVCFSM
jgi:hypothetical protein